MTEALTLPTLLASAVGFSIALLAYLILEKLDATSSEC